MNILDDVYYFVPFSGMIVAEISEYLIVITYSNVNE